MKKKNLKNKTEEAFKVVEAFKTYAEVLQKTEQDKEFVKLLSVSVRKMDKLEKEIVALKEKLKNKKSVFEQESELTFEYVKTAKKILNNELDKKLNPLRKQKKLKPPKAVKVEEPT